MTFFVQGLNGHERMPLAKVFKEPVVEKVAANAAEHAIEERELRGQREQSGQRHDAAQEYKFVKQLSQAHAVISGEEIMTSPVVTLDAQATVEQALTLLRAGNIHHLPVVSAAGLLLGIVSDRDVLRYLGGITENYQAQVRHNSTERVDQLMSSPVLTASRDTDVRYIARLFVEKRIGALPIVSDGELQGIITRSDVLKAVMHHFVLDLWA